MKYKLHIYMQELFQFSLVTYLILQLAETIQEGFVSFFFNINYLLFVVITSGLLMILTENPNVLPQPPKKITSFDVQNIILIAIGGGLLVHYKTQDLGKISLYI